MFVRQRSTTPNARVETTFVVFDLSRCSSSLLNRVETGKFKTNERHLLLYFHAPVDAPLLKYDMTRTVFIVVL